MKRLSVMLLLVPALLVMLALRVGVAQTTPPAWQTNTTYAVGAQATFNAIVYECLQAHTSQVGWEPPNAPALWQRPASPPPGVLAEWAPGTAYPLGGRAVFNDVTYEALQAHTSQVDWEPPVVPALWRRPVDTSGGVPPWAVQQAYNVGSQVSFNGEPFQAMQAHTSTLGSTPLSSPGVWTKPSVVNSCAAAADGTFCHKDWLFPGFDGGPVAKCLNHVCARANVPEAVHHYPWAPDVKLTANNTAELSAAFAAADANPTKLYTVYLKDGFYDVTEPLTLEKGSILVYGHPSSPLSVVIENPDPTKKVRIFQVGLANTGMPLLALVGVTVTGGRTDRFISDSGAGIAVAKGGLIVEDSRIVDNQTVAGGIGVTVNQGFLYMARTEVSGNVNPLLGNCGGGRFTAGGGIAVDSIEEGYIFDSTIVGNKHCRSAGVRAAGTARLLLSQNTISGNSARTFGGGVTVKDAVELHLEFNTIASNHADNAVASGEPTVGTGLVLFTYTGKLSMVGNVISGNLRGTSSNDRDDLGAAGDTAPGTSADPYRFQVVRSHLDNVEVFHLPAFPADQPPPTPAGLHFDPTLWTMTPMLPALASNGAAPGYQVLQTHQPLFNSVIRGQYSSNSADAHTRILPQDQRHLNRPSVQTTTPGSVDPDAVQPPVSLLTFEAEAGAPTAPLQVKSDTAASGGKYVEVATGNNSTGAPPSTGQMTFTFTVPQHADWKLWGRVQAPNTNSDSFWVKIDDHDWFRWDLSAGAAWHWDDVNDFGQNNAPVLLNLERGRSHVLKVAYREDGARLDRLLLTTDPTFVPPATGP
jgi:hypothetical protein